VKRHGVSWKVKTHGFLGSKKAWISWKMESLLGDEEIGVSWEMKI